MKFTPIAPTELNGNLLEKAEYICIESPKLIGGYNKTVISEIKSLLRVVNSYYSNRIESEGTHPINIEKAMKKEFSQDAKEKQLQHLSIAYIKTQVELEHLVDNDATNPFDMDFMKDIHEKFYTQEGMENFLDINFEDKIIKMIPGKLRKDNVHVGNHIAIEHDEVESTLEHFSKLYKDSIRYGLKAQKLLYILSSHHRFVWIHPFLDGNGRTSRLMLDLLFEYMKVEGYGLWNISRGLARENNKYKRLLAHADETRLGDLDGRGNLSKKELYNLVEFMLDVAIDQIDYMKSMLEISSLFDRVVAYVKFSQENMYNIKPLPKHSERLLKELLIKGIIKRREVQDIIGTKDRIASKLIKELIERDYIQSDTPRGDIRIKFNAHFAMKIFPELIPELK